MKSLAIIAFALAAGCGGPASTSSITNTAAQPGPTAPLVAQLIAVSVAGSEQVVTFNKGSRDGICVGWQGYLLRNGNKLAGGELVVIQVTDRTAKATVTVTDLAESGVREAYLAPPP